MSPFATKTAISHPIFTAIDSDENSDEPEDTINVAVDPTSSKSLPPRPPLKPLILLTKPLNPLTTLSSLTVNPQLPQARPI